MILVSRDRPGDGREGYGVLGGGTTATLDFTFSCSMKIGFGVRMMRMKKSSWMSHEKLILEPMKFYFVGLVLRFGAPHRPLPFADRCCTRTSALRAWEELLSQASGEGPVVKDILHPRRVNAPGRGGVPLMRHRGEALCSQRPLTQNQGF